MDANRLRAFLLAEERHYKPLPAALRYDPKRRSLRLSNQRTPPAAATPFDRDALAARLEVTPQTMDAFGTRAFFDSATGQVLATGALPGLVPIFKPAAEPDDLAIGHDGILYLAVDGNLVMVDRRGRFEPTIVHTKGFAARRLASDPRGGVWALDPTSQRVARLRGTPRNPPPGTFDADVFRPQEENPDAPRVVVLPEIGFGALSPIAIACGPDGRLALLSVSSSGETSVHLQQGEGFAAARPLAGATSAFSLAFAAADRLAVLVLGLKEAPVYRLSDLERASPDPALPIGDFYPLRDHDGSPFVHGTTLPPAYKTPSEIKPLHFIPMPAFARRARADNATPLDGGSLQGVWHRLYLEAVLPPGCGIDVFLAATDEAVRPPDDAAWHEHRFGSAPNDNSGTPRGVWVPFPSELPYHPGLLSEAPKQDEAGLFTVLIQRCKCPVRALRGRFLWVRIELRSDGRKTPELFALRAYAARFSYRDRYLPELYHETSFGLDAEGDFKNAKQAVRSTPPDFLERMLANFEGILTPIEDRIAASYLLTDARSTTEEALPWLASWIGFSFDPAVPESRRRALLAAAPELYRFRGTLRGLKLALDVASGGSVRDGRTIVVEDFRLRRTFATILGADLSGSENPLLPGLGDSGNSFVGDTLFIGDEEKKEFLALFRAEVPQEIIDGSPRSVEEQAVQDFFDRLAHRVTILVHNEISPVDLGLLRRVVELEIPAHVEARVVAARTSFMVGMAALIGIDTYLVNKPAPQPVEIERSQLGVGDRLLALPALDPRLQQGGVEGGVEVIADDRPRAVLGAARIVASGSGLVLDASGSIVASGHSITRFHWTLLPSSSPSG